MHGKWIGAALACALWGAALGGCDGGDSAAAAGTGGSGGGNGGTTAAGGGGSGGTTAAGGGGAGGTTSTSTTEVDPCAGEITGFVPEWKPSEGHHQGLCTEAQITEFFAACIESSASEADCNAFNDASAENVACAMCAVSAPADPAYGPMTVYDDLALLYENPGQCVSVIEGDLTEASCGAKVFSTIQCQVAACSECKEVDFNVLLGCLEDAKAGSCKPFADAEAACIADLQAQNVPIEPCFQAQGQDFFTYMKALTLLACGP